MSSSEIQKPKPSLLSLPNDLLLSCLARVSRLYYPTLSLVSKQFLSLLASQELYKVRSSLGNTESCLYVCLTSDFKSCWFTLCRKPDHQTLRNEKKKLGEYVLARVPIPHSPLYRSSGLVAVGYNIYNISGLNHLGPSSYVSILDSRSHTWSEIRPNLGENRFSIFATAAVDENIYVAERYRDDNCYNFKEVVKVLDTQTQIWDHVPITCSQLQGKCFLGSACLDGKFYVNTEDKVAAYDYKEGRWDLDAQKAMGNYLFKDHHCVIENVLYSIVGGMFRWYDNKENMWRMLKGLEGLPKLPHLWSCIKLADYGGKMAVLWTKDLGDEKIWCAEITLEKRTSFEIWGKVEWSDLVLTVPLKCSPVEVLICAVTI